ncbi:efflux RND transporter periplasmic adaptor subunit [Paenibacillus xerothermodurans]|uniref:Efflux RND transporter periplasmic adaptor subunit n=1 Tax=Paenibacillus xerothermodurans TaxID=1977292 RepID=A0A2W1NDJ3_PAEXE|nr:efflux RND transporter periplasmic adaptor subunit [Paenibacillus xerothermodurans]PZE22769.1 efflux RND transporter periplasmic adaptor subunit [Paenibacillus xerothermodurans]
MIRWIQNVSKKWIITAVAVCALVSVLGTTLLTGSGGEGGAAQPGGTGRQGAGAARQFPVETQIVKLQEVGGGQVFTGAITPPYATNVSSRVAGRVMELMVKPGDRVTTGQPLAKIDTSELEQQVAQSESALAVSAAQLQRTTNEQANSVANAEKQLATQRANLDKAIAEQQNSVEAAKQQLAISQANYNKAVTDQQNAIASAKQSVAISQQNLNNALNTYTINLSNAQNALNIQQDALQTSEANSSNAIESLRLELQQAIINYANARENGSSADKDAAQQRLQQAQLELDQVQQTTPSALTSATGALLKAESDLTAAQNSQSVQIAQEQLNRDTTTLANAQNTLLATLETSRQTLSKDELALANAETNRQLSMNVSTAQLEQQEQALVAAKSTDAVAVSTAQFNQAQTNLRLLVEDLQHGVLSSPVDGVVTSINTPVGQNAGAQSNILSVAALERTQATVNISEANIGKIKIGMEMKVNVPTLDKTFDGVVSAIRPTMDEVTKAYGVDITVNDEQKELLPGMFATCSLKAEGRTAIMVPADAVLSQPSGNAVFVVQDGRAKRVAVKVGTLTSSLFEITSGLSEGDELVVAGQELLSDKAAVQVVQPGQETPQNGRKPQDREAPGQGAPAANNRPGEQPQGELRPRKAKDDGAPADRPGASGSGAVSESPRAGGGW